jgi:hypothetical protein
MNAGAIHRAVLRGADMEHKYRIGQAKSLAITQPYDWFVHTFR